MHLSQLENEQSSQKWTDRSSNFKNLYRPDPGPLDGVVMLKNADNADTGH